MRTVVGYDMDHTLLNINAVQPAIKCCVRSHHHVQTRLRNTLRTQWVRDSTLKQIRRLHAEGVGVFVYTDSLGDYVLEILKVLQAQIPNFKWEGVVTLDACYDADYLLKCVRTVEPVRVGTTRRKSLMEVEALLFDGQPTQITFWDDRAPHFIEADGGRHRVRQLTKYMRPLDVNIADFCVLLGVELTEALHAQCLRYWQLNMTA
jgi:hypothetical protein